MHSYCSSCLCASLLQVLERYITPYMYAVTDCHTQKHKPCWYPGQASAPPSTHPSYRQCNSECKPHLTESVFGRLDYPVDEWTLSQAFQQHADAEEWLNFHFQYFMTRKDLARLKRAGLTHLRVPLPHWILGGVQVGEPWVVGDRWKYFVRMCGWARELGLEVWPDIHTAVRLFFKCWVAKTTSPAHYFLPFSLCSLVPKMDLIIVGFKKMTIATLAKTGPITRITLSVQLPPSKM